VKATFYSLTHSAFHMSLYIPARDDYYNDESPDLIVYDKPSFDYQKWKSFRYRPGRNDPVVPMFSQNQKRVTASMAPYKNYRSASSARVYAASAAYRNPMSTVGLTPYQKEYLKGAPARREAALAKQRAKASAAKANSLERQVKALIAGKKRDAADVTRVFSQSGVNTSKSTCLTSTTDFGAPGTAASGTGILDFDGDSALINHIDIRGTVENTSQLLAAAAGSVPSRVRALLVWFYKPLQIPTAAGTLPPMTEVLVTDHIDSMQVTDAKNAGRFTVLFDRTYNLGVNTLGTAAASLDPRVNGTNIYTLDERIKIDKKISFKGNCASGTPAGHYDDDVSPGQIDRGLCVLYCLSDADSGVVQSMNLFTRLNYTA